MILLFLSLFLFSQDFEDAVRHYEQGKLSEALAVLDDISGKETRREEVKNLLIKILTELGMELSFQERYEEAFSYFEKALALDPGDSFLKEIHATTQGLLRESREKGKMEEKKEEAAVPGKSSPDQSGKKEQKKTVSARGPAMTFQAGELKTLLVAFLKLQQQLDKALSGVLTSQDHMRIFIKQAEAKDRALLDNLSYSLGAFSRFFYTSVFGIVGTVAIVGFLMYLIFYRLSMKKEGILLRYQESLLELVRQKEFLPKAAKIPVEVESIEEETRLSEEGRWMLLELLEKELDQKKKMERNVGLKLLGPFLRDDSLRVKEKAFSLLFSYNRKEAEKLLLSYTRSSNRDETILFLRLADLLPVRKVSPFLMKILETGGEEVKKEAVRLMVKMKARGELGRDLTGKWEELKKKEEWITE